MVGSSIVVLGIICGASLFKTLSLRAGGGAVARSLGGTRIERSTGDIALKRLHNVVEEMAIASGVTMPEVYVLEHEDGINAFAAGNSPADAAIAVTRGAATRLKREELQGVIAHEFSHILNGDMRLNVRLLGWTFGLAGGRHRGARRAAELAERRAAAAARTARVRSCSPRWRRWCWATSACSSGGCCRRPCRGNRERLADASAVQFTRNPVGLSGALLKIAGAGAGSRLVTPEAEEVAHMLFAAGLPRLFATHPPIEERLKALDPSFRASELPTLAAEAARDAERQRADGRSARPAALEQTPRARAHSRRPATAVFAAHAAHRHRGAGRHHRQRKRALCRRARASPFPKACAISSTPPITRAR